MTGMRFLQPNGNAADLVILQGKTLSSTFIWGGNTPIDVTGYSATLVVRKSVSDTAQAFAFTVGNGRVTIGGANGQIGFLMNATDSAALTAPFDGVYEIELTTDAGVVHRVLSGKVVVEREVAR